MQVLHTAMIPPRTQRSAHPTLATPTMPARGFSMVAYHRITKLICWVVPLLVTHAATTASPALPSHHHDTSSPSKQSPAASPQAHPLHRARHNAVLIMALYISLTVHALILYGKPLLTEMKKPYLTPGCWPGMIVAFLMLVLATYLTERSIAASAASDKPQHDVRRQDKTFARMTVFVMLPMLLVLYFGWVPRAYVPKNEYDAPSVWIALQAWISHYVFQLCGIWIFHMLERWGTHKPKRSKKKKKKKKRKKGTKRGTQAEVSTVTSPPVHPDLVQASHKGTLPSTTQPSSSSHADHPISHTTSQQQTQALRQEGLSPHLWHHVMVMATFIASFNMFLALMRTSYFLEFFLGPLFLPKSWLGIIITGLVLLLATYLTHFYIVYIQQPDEPYSVRQENRVFTVIAMGLFICIVVALYSDGVPDLMGAFRLWLANYVPPMVAVWIFDLLNSFLGDEATPAASQPNVKQVVDAAQSL